MNTVQRLLACAVVALLTWPAAAQRAGRAEDEDPIRDQQAETDEEFLVVRIHDVSDLLIGVASFPAQHESDMSQTKRAIFPQATQPVPVGFGGMMGGMGAGGMGAGGMGGMGAGGMGGGSMGGMGGGFFSVPEQIDIPDPAVQGQVGHAGGQAQASPRVHYVLDRVSLDDLIETITSTIAPDTWDDVGGMGSITALAQTLVISHTTSVHREVAELLEQLRHNWDSRPTVILHAFWLWQTNEQVAELMKAKREAAPRGVVPPEQWRRWLSDEADERAGDYLASTTCFSGQTVHVQAGIQNLHVTGITPIVGSDPAYSPQVSMVQDGAVLQVTPVCRAGDPHVTLEVHSRVTLRQPSKPVVRQPGFDVGNMPLQSAAAVDRPVLQVQRLSTTTRLLMDQVTLIGGMSFAEEADARNLFLYVVVSPTK